MISTPRRVLACTLVVLIGAFLAPSPRAIAQTPEPPHVFENMTFLEAKHKAESEDKVLYVEGVVATSQDALKMDLDVFRNPRVVSWLEENAVCLKIDADIDLGEAQRLKLGPYPTHIFIKDDKLIDRLDGYLNPSEFLSLAKGAARGRTTGERIEEEYRRALRNGYDKNADVRYAYAQKLLENKRYEAATEEFVFLWNNVVSLDRKYAKSRHDLAGLAGKIKELVSQHPPARESFLRIRDELTPKVAPSLGAKNVNPADVQDWVVLNDIVRDWPTLLAWTNAIVDANQNAMLEMAGEPLYDALLVRFQWKLAGMVFNDPINYLNKRKAEYGDRIGNPTIDSYFLEKIANIYAACLAADRLQDAMRIANYAIAFKDQPMTYSRLEEKAEIAGIPEDMRRVWPQQDAQGPPGP